MDNAFDAGIERGGLRSINDIKMLICYVLSSLGEPIAKSLLVESLTVDGLANYFEITDAIASLVSTGRVIEKEADGASLCEITKEGSMLTAEIETAVPYVVREKAINCAVSLISKAKNAKETDVEIFQCENGYMVTCSVNDKSIRLFSVSILVADELQANFVKDNFIKNPGLIYGGAMALLSGKSEIIADMINRSKN